MIKTSKITPNLWFDKNAEDAVNFYTSIFPGSEIGTVSHYGKEGFEFNGMPEGTVLVMQFSLSGQSFMALNGGPIFKFNESISFVIECKDQEEVDHYWNNLSAGGDENAKQCGWLKDKFGVSWQVVPEILGKLMSSNDKEIVSRVMISMMQMKKMIVADLEQAAGLEH